MSAYRVPINLVVSVQHMF